MRPYEYVALYRNDYAHLRAGDREIHVGDIGYTRRSYIAHRAVQVRADGYFSCGDTWPCRTVWVPRGDYVGTVSLECTFPDSNRAPLLSRR
jgi:hypothetical protein